MTAALFYTAAGAFALGIFIRSFVTIGLPAITTVLVISFALALVWRRSRGTLVLFAGIVSCFGALGLLRMEVASWDETSQALEPYVGEEITLTGSIMREPEVRDTTTHLHIDTEHARILAITDRFTEYEYGDQVHITGELIRPESFETDLGRTFDYPKYLQARGITYQIIYGDIERAGVDAGNPLIAALLDAKRAFMHAFESATPEPHAGLGEGLLLGEKRALGEHLTTVFRHTGIIHIVVLSGYNVMLVVLFVMHCFSYVFGVRARAVFGVLAIIAFAILVGLSATVVRASIMATLLLIAQATGRTYAIMRALFAAGCVMLILNPYLLAFDTGFQLSFIATAGLILFAPVLAERLTFVPAPKLVNIREFVTATLASQLFVLPILLYQIGEFSLVAVLVNVLVLPMVPMAMLLTFATGMVALVSSAAALPLAYATYYSLEYILAVAQWFGTLPFAAYVVPAFPFWVVPIAYAAMGYGAWRMWQMRQDTTPQSERVDMRDWTVVSEESLLGVRR